MQNDAYLQIRTALDSSTESTGGDDRTGVGAVFIQKGIDRMIRETINRGTDFRQLVQRKTMDQKAYIWNLKTSIGTSVKVRVYGDGGTGVPFANEYLQMVAPAISYRSDYEVTGFALATSSSYFDAINEEAKDALTALALTEEQMFILGNDTDDENTGITLNGKIGVASSYAGLKQLLSSAVALADGDTGGLADSTTKYTHVPSSTSTEKEYKLNCQCVNTASDALNPLSIRNLDSAITVSNIWGGKAANRIYLVSERRMNEVKDLIAPQGRFVMGASSVELDGGASVLAWNKYKIISTRLMAFNGVTGNGSAATFTDTDNSVLFLDMDSISFRNVAGVDARHVPIMGASASQRSDVEGGYFKTYGVFVVEKFNTQVIIYNLSTP